MDPAKEVSFEEVLEQVPRLLDACVGEDISALRRLRLVSKEASRVALLAIQTYTLTLKGSRTDTNIGGAGMLQATRLRELTVRLHLTGGFFFKIKKKGGDRAIHAPVHFSGVTDLMSQKNLGSDQLELCNTAMQHRDRVKMVRNTLTRSKMTTNDGTLLDVQS